MRTLCKKRKIMVAMLIKEIMDDDGEGEFILTEHAKFRKQVGDIFTNRRHKGTFDNLIESHLLEKAEKFQKYLKLPPERFSSVLNLIKEGWTTSPYNRVKELITTAKITQRTTQLTSPETVGSTASTQHFPR
ncbi:hypothetical protein KM043_013917 [Ampulex compressa]|nr:hypothetical protein KM043_013917 [Ampulex compressa]